MSQSTNKFVAVFKLLRVYQWTKNILVLAALVFAEQVFVPGQLIKSLYALGAFCLAASAMYVLNDIMDVNRDRAHPEKKWRPLARGTVAMPVAWIIFVLLTATAAGLSWWIRPEFFLALLFYVAVTTGYSLGLKNVIIIDTLIVAIGFVVRAMAGAIALDVVFSNWLVVCTLFLALFLALSKRRHEITVLEEDARHHRQVLHHYSVHYLDQLILIMASGALLTYTIYTCSPEVVNRFGTDKLYMTIPFVVYGLFRYLFLVHHRTDGGDPSRTLIKDIPLGLTVLSWGLTCCAIIYL
jgi:4-hydroxybenzoate polyprenyltransferase